VHEAGGYFYCDGANFNAIVGRVRPADLGVDAMHINLHKTFSTPHGGGGPGSGPVVFSKALAPYAPTPIVLDEKNGFRLLLSTKDSQRCGILKAYLGQFGTFVRALAYMMSMGGDGLAQASGDAVLNANYLAAQLRDVLSLSFEPPVMHEALFDDRFLKDTGVTTLDIAKALIDQGFHPMTMYFPLVVPGALLMEPTETESKETLDLFIAAMRRLAAKAKAGEVDAFKAAPTHAPRRRLDETKAARTPVLRWQKQ
jgi:glycine dehydrogenase subunit 2